MKTHTKIFVAFLLNFIFSIIEFLGGVFTGSFAIISDSVHDFGDSISIAIAYILEKISTKKPDNTHTYGYIRYSVLGSVITTVILLFGSLAIIYKAVPRIITPQPINHDGMLLFSLLGIVINFVAMYFTHGKDSLNEKAVSLHMLEDVLGWAVVLVGAVLMKFTKLYVIDPVLSVAVSAFIFINAIKNLKSVLDIFLEKTPSDIDVEEIKEHIMEILGVEDVHHIHIRTIDGNINHATMHVVTDSDPQEIKAKIKAEMTEHKIAHTTVEIERTDEKCEEINCKTNYGEVSHEHHHHHHHHH